MSETKTVTADEIRELIKKENIRPEDWFTPEQLKPLLDKARAEGYAQGSFQAAWRESGGLKPEGKEQASKEKNYLDPEDNPLIKTD
jgi:hypothetical protein